MSSRLTQSSWSKGVSKSISKSMQLMIGSDHRYLKKRRLLMFCYLPATGAASSNGIFVAATNNTNQTSIGWYMPLISLSFSDVYGSDIIAKK
jgi:hypothetical protein